MAFPGLLPITYDNGVQSNQVCERVGVPDNGNNVIALPWVGQGIPAALIDLDRIEFRVEALGASVTGATVVSLSADKTSATLSYAQSGLNSARTRATLHHTTIS